MSSRYRSSRPAIDSASLGSEREELLGAPERFYEGVDVVLVVVDVERGPGRRRDAEHPHQRLRAVVPGPDADAVLVEHLRDVVRVDALEGEGDRAAPALDAARPVDRESVAEA